MATLQQLEQRLIEADAAGEIQDAKILITEIRKKRELAQTETVQPEDLSALDTAQDIGVSAASGTYKGASYIPGVVGDIEQLGNQFLPKFLTRPIGSFFDPNASKEPTQLAPTSKQIRGYAEAVAPQLKFLGEYEPKTTIGEYAQTIPEFAAPGLLGKTKAARKFGLGLGAGTGATYETIENLTGSPLAAVGISLPLSIAASYFFGPTTAAKLSEKAFQNVSKQEIDEAIALETIAKTEDIKLLPGELVEDKLINQLTQDVLRSEKGAPYIYEAVKGRPRLAEELAEKQAGKIADMPESQRQVLKSIQETAKSSIIKSQIERRAAAYNAGYKVSNDQTIDTSQALNIIDNIDNLIQQSPQNSANFKKLKQLRKELVIKKGKTETPVTNINILDDVFKTYRDAVIDSRKNVATEQRFIQKDLSRKLFNNEKTGALDLLVDNLKTNPSYKKANEVFEELSKTLVDVVKDNTSVLAREGLDLTAIENFVFNPAKAKPSDINKTLKILNVSNPEATKQIANVYFRNAINNSFPIVKQGEDLTQGFKLIQKIAGTKGQRKNFLAVLDNVADAHGVPRVKFKVGFENMINILERTGRINNINKPGFNVQGIAARTLYKDLAMMKTFNPLVRLATKYGELKAGGAMDNLGRIMANDNAVASLVELGTTNPQSKAAISKVLNIINSVSPYTERSDIQPSNLLEQQTPIE